MCLAVYLFAEHDAVLSIVPLVEETGIRPSHISQARSRLLSKRPVGATLTCQKMNIDISLVELTNAQKRYLASRWAADAIDGYRFFCIAAYYTLFHDEGVLHKQLLTN